MAFQLVRLYYFPHCTRALSPFGDIDLLEEVSTNNISLLCTSLYKYHYAVYICRKYIVSIL